MHYRSMSMRFRRQKVALRSRAPMAHLSSGTRYMYLYLTIRPYTTYTINLDPGVYTTDELVTALNAAIETQGSVADLSGHFTGLPEAFTITTSIAYIDGHFLIRCSCTIAHPYGIEILSDATAAESLGFEQNQTAGVFGAFTADDILSFIGDDLDLVATNDAWIRRQ